MNALRNVFVLALFSTTCAMAQTASDDSVRELMVHSKMRSTMDAMLGQMNTMMAQSFAQGFKGGTLTDEEKAKLEEQMVKTTAFLREEMSWEKIEPMFLRIYKETFTEEEVTGMVAFYKTPAGQAMINKTPVLMQKSMAETQQMMAGSMAKLRQALKDARAEQAAERK